MKKPITIGSRPSPLALVQVHEVLASLQLPIAHEIKTYKSAGDIDKTSSLTSGIKDDFFTDILDQALLKGEIDVAIHSAKDLPKQLHPDLTIVALTQPTDDTDALVGKARLADLPANARIGTSSTLRQEHIKALRRDIQIVDVRGTIQERIDLVKEGKIDAVIIATCALKRLQLDHLIQDILPWEGFALQGQLAVVARVHDKPVHDLFKALDIRSQFGQVMLVGAGPGDPDLITVKAIKALRKADIVFYDYLADDRLLHYAPTATHIYVGKRKGAHSLPQDELNKALKDEAIKGKIVVRLKGGDPLIFGRGAEEMIYLKDRHIPVSVIPGISSATGIPADLGIPLTARDVSSSVSFLSAHEREETPDNPSVIHIPHTDTLVFLMGLTKLPHIINALKKSGKSNDYPIMIVSKGTRQDERIVQGTLGTIQHQCEEAHIEPPALIIAGNVTKFYQGVPSTNILYLGTNPLHYRKMGRIIHWPMLDIQSMVLNDAQKVNLIERFHQSIMVIFTSRFSVINTLRIIPVHDLSKKTIAAIGSHTADALAEFGLSASIVSKEETAQGLFKAIEGQVQLKGTKILFPRSNLPNPYLKQALIKEGAQVDEVTIYQNTKPLKRPLPNVPIDAVIFTSPSTVKNFLEDYDRIPESWEILAKGPVTAQALKEAGYESRIL